MDNVNRLKQIFLFLFLVLTSSFVTAQGSRSVANYNVVWSSLGTNENSSMPLGNGDIALNVWTEPGGDIVMLIAKADAWSENGQLMKLGRVRVSLTPNPFVNTTSFTQTLRLESGEMELRSGKNTVRIWVDANHPVVRLEAQTKSPVTMKAVSEIWRNTEYHLDHKIILEGGGGGGNFWDWKSKPDGLTFYPDTILPAENNRVSWCHFNKRSIYPLALEQEKLESLLSKYSDPLLHRCFGVTMKGKFLVSDNNQTLKSSSASRSQQLDIYAFTGQTDSPGSWRAKLDQEIAAINAVKRSSDRKAHELWWSQFWSRSWIHVAGTPDAIKISQSYAMQRYMTACAGRGAQPIKFNGSLFTVGHDLLPGTAFSEANHDPDYRSWGASYWNQNTRHIYWPLLASGDYDMLTPWFNMYVKALPLVEDRSREYFHHNGAAFIETMNFWGLPNVNDYGWDNPGPELSSPYMKYHIQGGIEVLTQMMDRYDYTQNADFAKNTLLPMADGIITFYDEHWKRGADGKILMSPSQSIETYQVNAVNPTPDVAGLKYILPRLLTLPTSLCSAEQRRLWTKVLHDLPVIPIGTTAKGKLPRRGEGDPDGLPTILPAEKYGASKNMENPELYAIFPYRIYGIGRADLQLARNTYNARLYPFNKCWGQDGMHAALLGLTDDAEKATVAAFTSYGDQSFPWFWSKNKDWIPDMDNGGGGMTTLQLMLMQCDDNRIQLLPAWPKDWTADFKLNAPFQTTVAGHVENGKITNLKVTPEARAKDVVIVKQQ